MDDFVTWAAVGPHLLRAAAFLVLPTVLFGVYLVLSYLRSISTPDPANNVIVNLVWLVMVLLYLAGIVAFFVPGREPLAEFSFLVRGGGPSVSAAYERIRSSAAARETPARVSARSVAGVPVLLFRQRAERAMVLVQPYGTDLYIGWTMWRARSPAVLALHFFRDTFGRALPLPWFVAELRASATRALRESVDALAWDGVAAAGSATPPPSVPRAPGPDPRERLYRPGTETGALPPPFTMPTAQPDRPHDPPRW